MVDKEEEAMLEMFPRYVNYIKPKRIFTWMNDYDSDEKIVVFGTALLILEACSRTVRLKKVSIRKLDGVLHHRTQKQIWNYGTSLQYSKQIYSVI